MGERRSFLASAVAPLRYTARHCHENCVEGGMHSPFHQQLMHEIYTIITLARPVVEAIERRDRELGTQMRRALNSIALNTAEGLGCHAGHGTQPIRDCTWVHLRGARVTWRRPRVAIRPRERLRRVARAHAVGGRKTA